ncbi:MAG: ABC transporter ATP-binding protein, partial [Bacteroidales bacterium]
LVSDITHEYNMTTIINTHDMNSVMGIGENIVFLNKGELCWHGTREEIFTSSNEPLNDFVFASNLLKEVKNYVVKNHLEKELKD